MTEATTQKPEPILTDVEIETLMIDKAFNSRVLIDGIKELAAELEFQGQLSPILVTPTGRKDKPFALVAGFRRVEAAKLLKWKNIKAIVQPMANEKEAFLANVAENLARNALTSYEFALTLKRMRDNYGMTAPEIAARIASAKGLSKSNINNHISAIESLHPKILKAWAAEDEICNLGRIFTWKALSKEQQLEEYEELAALRESKEKAGEGQEGDKSKGEKTKATPKRINRAYCEAALLECRKGAKQGVKGCDVAVSVLKFVLGFKDSPTLSFGDFEYDPKPAEEAPEGEE